MFITTRKTRKLVTGALVALLLGSTSALAAPFVFVPVGSGGQIDVVDVALGKIVDTYKGFAAVHGLAGTPDGKFLIAGSFMEHEKPVPAWSKTDAPMANNNASMSTNMAAGAKATTGKTGTGGDKMDAMMAKNSSNAKSGADMVSTVSILRKDTGKVVKTIDVPAAVHHVTTSPDGRFVALTEPRNNTISVINLKTYDVVTTLKTGLMPNYMAFGKDSKTLYVSNAGGSNVAVINTATWKVTGTIATGATPEHMILSHDGKTLYVNNNADGTVGVIDLATQKMVKTYKIGKRLHGLDITGDGSALLVAERDGNRIVRVDLATGAITKRDIGPAPYHVTTVAGSGLAFVTSADENEIRIIRQNDLSLVKDIPIEAVGHQMVVSQTR